MVSPSMYGVSRRFDRYRPVTCKVACGMSKWINFTVKSAAVCMYHPRYVVGIPSCFNFYFLAMCWSKHSTHDGFDPTTRKSSTVISAQSSQIESHFYNTRGSILFRFYFLF